MKSLIELAKSRHSVRKYEYKKVENEKIQILLESGRIAPTAVNRQPCKFLVINEEKTLEKVGLACNYHNAPLVILVLADKNVAWTRKYDGHSMVDIDATIATDHMMLCARDLGLDSCWITYFKPDILIKEFDIPENLIPVNILSIGYSAEYRKSLNRYQEDRKPLDTFVHYNSFE